jgi:hypothetical protein
MACFTCVYECMSELNGMACFTVCMSECTYIVHM